MDLLQKLKNDKEYSTDVAIINKNYNDAEAKNLLDKSLGQSIASYGAYNISATTGSAKAASKGISNEYELSNNKTQKLFDLKLEKINNDYKYNTSK